MKSPIAKIKSYEQTSLNLYSMTTLWNCAPLNTLSHENMTPECLLSESIGTDNTFRPHLGKSPT